MDNYKITKNTFALIPIDKYRTKIIENYITYIVDENIKQIIEKNCLFYCSSLKGRIEATSYLIGVKYKAPVILSELLNLVFFPTLCPDSEDCIWINIDSVSEYKKLLENTIITFKNSKKLKINVSENIISNQILKSSRLLTVLRSKKT